MDKSELNTAIIKCKPAVNKAKVHIIRDIRKKIAILEKCKKENEKEKKHKKAERLVEEIMTIKKLKFDEVMRFALHTINVEDVLKTPANQKEHACAVLAKHSAVKDKVNFIWKKFNDLENELFPLLDQFNKLSEKKTKDVKEKKKIKSPEENEGKSVTDKKDSIEVASVKKKPKLKSKKKKNSSIENKNQIYDNNEKIENSKLLNLSEIKPEKESNTKTNKFEGKTAILGKAKSKEKKKLILETNNSKEKVHPKNYEISSGKVKDNDRDNNNDNDFKSSDSESDEEKVLDPFFVNKKVLKPKSLDTEDQNLEDNSEVFESDKFKRNPKNSLWNVKDHSVDSDKFLRQKSEKQGGINKQRKRTSPQEELHPSWAAKKSIKPIIQPFQGKKIKFNDD